MLFTTGIMREAEDRDVGVGEDRELEGGQDLMTLRIKDEGEDRVEAESVVDDVDGRE